jgi:predicted dehydrogenase
VAILLVGLGRGGEQHLRVLRELGQDVWVADGSAARRGWAERQGVPRDRAVSDYREALSEVDAVDVVTPADSHRAIVGACLAAGRHCFVEKPLTVTAAESRGLVEAARASGRVLQVGHILRFHPVTAALRGALREGRIGAVRYATGRFTGFKRPRTDVGVTQTDAIHHVDLFAHLLGRAATSVLAVQRDYLGRGLDDMSVTIVHYGDIPCVVEASYFVPGTQRECVIVGETGSLVADFVARSATLYGQEFRKRGANWEAADRGKESLAVADGEPLKLELAAFLAACSGQGPTVVTAEMGHHAVAVVEAAARSSALGRMVSLAELL